MVEEREKERSKASLAKRIRKRVSLMSAHLQSRMKFILQSIYIYIWEGKQRRASVSTFPEERVPFPPIFPPDEHSRIPFLVRRIKKNFLVVYSELPAQNFIQFDASII